MDQVPLGDDAELLLRELNHRVFNMLQVIAAQTQRLGGETQLPELHSKLQNLSSGLFAFAELHRGLLPNDRGPLHDAIDDVCQAVVQGFGRRDIQIFSHVEEVPIGPLQRHRLLLIAAELVTNALKHSFAREGAGAIWTEVHLRDRNVVVETSDSSPGNPLRNCSEPSRMVVAIARSLGGEAAVFDRNGFATRVWFPLAAPVFDHVAEEDRSAACAWPNRGGSEKAGSVIDPMSPPAAFGRYRSEEPRPVIDPMSPR